MTKVNLSLMRFLRITTGLLRLSALFAATLAAEPQPYEKVIT